MIWRLPLALALLLLAIWGSGALYFRGPFAALGNAALITLFVISLLASGWCLLRRSYARGPYLAALLALGALAGWYSTFKPSDTLHWAPDVARRSLVSIEQDEIVVRNVRNFVWHGENAALERWEDRHYSLAKLETLDVFLSYWMGPNIAHLITSFGFSDGRQLAFSTEIRKQIGQDYDPLAGFFRSYTLAVIAADEADVIKVRTNRRAEDIYRYRLDLKPETVRLLFKDYAALTQKLERQPAFYNTVLDNCSMVPYQMVRLRDAKAIPFDWRILSVGHLPEYLAEQGFLAGQGGVAEQRVLATDTALKGLRDRARITHKAIAAETAPDFSAAIRAP
jgi:Domain of unknown function (DUF4105)